MVKLKPYPKYKDSGIQWIGEIPEGWGIKKIKFISSRISDGDWVEFKDQVEEGDYKLIQLKNVGIDQIKNDTDKEITKDFFRKNNCTKIREGDLLIARIPHPVLRATVFSKKFGDCITVVDVAIITPKDIVESRYLSYFLNSDYSKSIGDSLTTGATRQRITRDNIENMLFFFPNLIEEQKDIVNFLDKKTAKIDTLIEKDKKLIALLKERRTALINHAVTKGLDPNAKLKDSGVEWVGEIPKEWEVRKLKFVSEKITTGKTPPSENHGYYDNGEINWFTPGDMGKEFILKKSARKITSLALLENKTIKYQPKTVLLVGIGATLGKVGMITDIGTSNQQINAIQFDESEINPEYGLYYLYGYKNAIISLSNTSTIGIFNQTQTANFFIIIPPKEEQQKIVDYLDKATSKIDKTIQKIEQKIKLLEEYKKSLIHHVVTGKVDVRGVEA